MKIEEVIEAEIRDLPEIRRRLHAHPGLAFEEEHASDLIRLELARAGVPFAAGLARTGVVGWIVPQGAEGREGIALRAEMDALPIEERTGLPHASTVRGRMHACGHDGHMAILIGAARVLVRLLDSLPRPVKVIFQPAEETGEGAAAMVEAGALDERTGGFRVGAIFGLHGWPPVPAGSIAVRAGPLMASMDSFRIRVDGRGGHASAPHEAADPIVAAAAVVTALQSIVSRNVSPLVPAVITVASIHAGEAGNVIPASAVLGGTIRALDESSAAGLRRRLEEVAEMTARAHGCSAAVEVRRGCPVTVNDPGATRLVVEAAGEALGAGRVIALDAPTMAAEDFSVYGRRVPACFFFLGLAPPEGGAGPRLHVAEFDFNDAAIGIGVSVLCRIALKR